MCYSHSLIVHVNAMQELLQMDIISDSMYRYIVLVYQDIIGVHNDFCRKLKWKVIQDCQRWYLDHGFLCQ